MLVHPQFDPVALALGPVPDPLVRPDLPGRLRPVPLAGRAARALPAGWPQAGWTRRDVEDLLFYGVLGVVIGGRLGYVLFYKPGYYAAHPLEVLAVWKGGMSFHGGLLGVIAAMALFARTRGRTFLQVTDLIAPCVPTGLASGRIGNFINGELWGRAADPSLPWAMVFPQSGSDIAAPPVAAVPVCAGRPAAVRAAVVVRAASRGSTGQVSGAFLVGYGVFRFIAEFFREPDSFLGLRALRPEPGPVAVRADDRRRRVDVAGGAEPGTNRRDATDLPRHRDHRPERRGRRPHHRDRLRRDGQPAPDRRQPPLLPEPAAAQPPGRAARCTA